MLHFFYKALLPQGFLYVVDHHFAFSSLLLLVCLSVASVVNYLRFKVPFCLRSLFASHRFLVVICQAEWTKMCTLIINLLPTQLCNLLVFGHLLLNQILFVALLDIDFILELGLILHASPFYRVPEHLFFLVTRNLPHAKLLLMAK